MGIFSTTVDRVYVFYGRLDEYAYHFAAYLIQTNVLPCCALQSPRNVLVHNAAVVVLNFSSFIVSLVISFVVFLV